MATQRFEEISGGKVKRIKGRRGGEQSLRDRKISGHHRESYEREGAAYRRRALEQIRCTELEADL